MANVQTLERKTNRPEEATQTRWRRFAILAGAVVLVGAIALYAGRDDNSPTAFTDTDAMQIVEAYYEAVEEGDADAIAAAFSPESQAEVAHLIRFSIWDTSQGTESSDRSCSANEGDAGSFDVICKFSDYPYLSRVIGAPRTPTTEWMNVTAAGIMRWRDSYGTPRRPANVPFNFWLTKNHPQDARATYCCLADSIEEARGNGELRRRYADLWAAYLQETGCAPDDIVC